eukprot:4335482-Lingulodinium_polyedra.AAC.1
MQSTKKFNVSLGKEEARVLAVSWAHKMQYLWDSHQEGLLQSAATRAACLEAYEEPEEFASLMTNASKAVKEAGMFIRKMQP